VIGDSAGSGLSAALALLARDRGRPALAQQILIYPMLDDRVPEPDPRLVPFLVFSYDDNATGWEALLGDHAGKEGVSPYAAPARADDLGDLPDAYIEAAQLDVLRNEAIAYAQRLADPGVPAELHVHPGCPHGFDLIAPNAGVSQHAVADRIRRIRSL
jgi:acetyl esterase/lipase